MPFSEEALKAVVELVKEKLEYFKQRPLKSDWLCVFIDAYHGGMRVAEGRVVEVSIFVAVGIDLRYGKMLQNKTEHYIAFLRSARQIREHLYTTNPVEGLNAGLELGGYFPSQDCLEVNLFI